MKPRPKKRHYLRDLDKLMSGVGKYMGHYGTAIRLAQLFPIVVGLLAVFFSPSAWLSETLRRWAVAGVALGGVAGMGTLALFGLRTRHAQSLAALMLLLFLASAALLRLHLALADVAFAERWAVVQPLQDFFLGSDAGELLYNALAALWFAVLLFAATLGLPLYMKWRSEQKRTDAADAATEVRTALATISKHFETSQETIALLQEQNRALKAELEARQALLEQLQPGAPARKDVQKSNI